MISGTRPVTSIESKTPIRTALLKSQTSEEPLHRAITIGLASNTFRNDIKSIEKDIGECTENTALEDKENVSDGKGTTN